MVETVVDRGLGVSQAGQDAKHEAIYNDAPRFFEDFPVGSVSHQGDIMLVAIGSLPNSAKARANRQLAEGNTQGSRHVWTNGDVYDADVSEIRALIKEANGCDVDARYIGPVIVSGKSPTANDLQHPEHGNQGFPPGTICAIVYQRNLDAEEREARVRD